MKYYIIAGEASGDLHASNLMKEIRLRDKEAEFRCWGGDQMKEQGGVLVKHYRDLAFMGFTEVLMNIGTIIKNIALCKADIESYHPDAVILVDYPGFNLRIAKYAKTNGFPVFYYISPQVWAWKQSRVHKIKRVVDKMFVILPFEKEFYQTFDYDVDFVGHPLLDAIDNHSKNKKDFTSFCREHQLSSKPVIAILPGSRKQEIAMMLPVMLKIRNQFPDYQFVIAGAPSVDYTFYAAFIKGTDVHFVGNQTYQLLGHAEAALVTSGTATLETALFGVPEVVCYKGGVISYNIARKLVNVKYISLVNLIMDDVVVKELIQDDFNEIKIKEELHKILEGEGRKRMIQKFDILRQKLGGAGASAKAAGFIQKHLTS